MLSTENPACILLIDDSGEDLFFAKRLLSRVIFTHALMAIDDAEEGVAYLRNSLDAGSAAVKPSAIFCDVRMPKLNGLEVLRWTRAQAEFSTVPFFILSGGNVEGDRQQALELGANAYLVKFPTSEDLRLQLARVGIL